MRLLLLGATGGTGLRILAQALAAGHEVTTYVRNPHKIAPRHENIKVIQGLLDEESKLIAAIRGHDAVLSALGHRSLRDPTPLIANAMRVVVRGMQEHGVKRLLYEGAYGTGSTGPDLGVIFGKIIKPLILKHSYDDHEAAERIIRQSSLDWTIVMPTRLTNGKLTGVYQAKASLRGSSMQISRADVADFMLNQITATTWVRQAVGLAY